MEEKGSGENKPGFPLSPQAVDFPTVLLNNLLKVIPAVIFFKDSDGRYLRVSREFLKKFDIHEESEVLGKTIGDFFSNYSSHDADLDDEFIINSGTSIHNKEHLEILKDGQEVWAKLSKFPLEDSKGNLVGTLGISFDISDIRKTEEDLRTLMDNLPDNIYFKDRNLRYFRLNKSMGNQLSIDSPEQALDKTDSFFFTKESAVKLGDLEQRVLDTGLPQISKAAEIETKIGQRTWLSLTVLPIYNHQGEISGIFGVSRDISHLKDVEQKLQDANTHLEEKVRERTSQLSKANLGMEIRLQQLKFLNNKAHFFSQIMDLESLLSVIYFAFAERYPEAQIQLSTYENDKYQCVHQSAILQASGVQAACLEALNFLEPRQESEVGFDRAWKQNSFLKNLFPHDLEPFPCYLVVPLVVEKRLRGAVQLFLPGDFEKIRQREEMVLSTLSVQAAIALDSAYHYQRLKHTSKIESQLEVAQKIQDQFIPKNPKIPGFAVQGMCRSANAVGGDYLDFFENANGDHVVVIADVCGKGIPAALVMTSLRSSVRAQARNFSSSKSILAAVNQLMGPDLQADFSFITCLCMVIKKGGRELNFTRAGHPGLVKYGPDKDLEFLNPSGIALGMVGDAQFGEIVQECEVSIEEGDTFIAHTDGLDEAMNHIKDTYGFDRLHKVLRFNKSEPPSRIVKKVLQDVEKFSGGYPQFDDLTLFALRRE